VASLAIDLGHQGAQWAVARVLEEIQDSSLGLLFKKEPSVGHDLSSSIAAMELPEAVEAAAKEETGVVNFYNAYRNEPARRWCNDNAESLREIIRNTSKLGFGPKDDQVRFKLAKRIGDLPCLPIPKRTVPGSQLLTPLIAFLDPGDGFLS
jgi:hypothetical protein